MSDAIRATAGPIPRPQLETPILEEALRAAGSPSSDSRPPAIIQILQGPRGSGRSVLLDRLAGRLAAAGVLPVSIDLEVSGAGPLEMAQTIPAKVDRAFQLAGLTLADDGSTPASRLRRSIGEELARSRPSPLTLLEQALAYPFAVARAIGRPVALLIDEMGEARHLTRHPGLKNAARIFSDALAAAAPGCVIGTVSSGSRPAPMIASLLASAEERGATATVIPVPPFIETEMAAFIASRAPHPSNAPVEIEAWMRASAGHPLYAETLARLGPGQDLTQVLASALTPPYGALHLECRFDYHQLIERSRGHGAVRSILRLLAGQRGGSLTEVARHLKIALPTALDYLSWLIEVGLIRRDGPGYVIADPLLETWVRLNGPRPLDPLEEAVRLLQTPRSEPRPPSRPRGRRPGFVAARPPLVPRPTDRPFRPDVLRMEID